MQRAVVFVVLFVVVSLPHVCRGYSVQSPITRGCHESIAIAALADARAATGGLMPVTPDRDQAALIADLPYTLTGDDAHDFAAAALVLAIVDNDLKGYGPTDELELVPITSDPTLQREHCLRTGDEDEPGGTAAALADCAASLHERVAQAIAGLGADGDVDAANVTTLPVFLDYRGPRTSVALPTYWVRMGQALHTLEDSFAHTYRSTDQLHPTVALNWVDQQAGRLVESRDGPGHSLALDRCDDPDAMRTLRRQAATAAASALLQATLVTGTSADKLAAADAVITQYTTMQAGCDYANKWCDAPEAALPDTLACACTFGAAPTASPRGWLVPLALLALLLVRRRVRALATFALYALATVALLLVATAAHAQSAPPPPSDTRVPATGAPATSAPATGAPATGAPASDAASDPAVVNAPLAAPPGSGTVEPGRQTATPTRAEIADVRAKKKLGPRFGAQLTLGGAVDRAAAQVALGLRFRIDERWQVGLDAEYNPFFSIDGHDARPGALNVYFVGVRRYPMLWNRVNLRTTVQAGVSTLLFDLYGAPAGSVGPYVGVSLLGVDFDLGHALRLVIDPTNIALPVPHLSGQPFYYLQYRLTIALAFGG